MTTTQLPAASLYEGALIDLEAIADWLGICPEADPDAFLYPCGDCDSIRIAIQFEYARVDEVIPETSECVLVHTSQGSFGLPPDLLVSVIH